MTSPLCYPPLTATLHTNSSLTVINLGPYYFQCSALSNIIGSHLNQLMSLAFRTGEYSAMRFSLADNNQNCLNHECDYHCDPNIEMMWSVSRVSFVFLVILKPVWFQLRQAAHTWMTHASPIFSTRWWRPLTDLNEESLEEQLCRCLHCLKDSSFTSLWLNGTLKFFLIIINKY